MINPKIIQRFDELISEGEKQWWDYQKGTDKIKDPVRYFSWTTSCLNLLDRLSVSTNRFVTQFESTLPRLNIGAALGVLQSAREEYKKGLAIDYHLSVASAVFGDLLSQADYLLQKGYLRASAVLLGAALEEALKARAKAVQVEVSDRATITPLLHKLKAPDVGVLSEIQSKNLEAIAKVRNDAAHGGKFEYKHDDIESALSVVQITIGRILGER